MEEYLEWELWKALKVTRLEPGLPLTSVARAIRQTFTEQEIERLIIHLKVAR